MILTFIKINVHYFPKPALTLVLEIVFSSLRTWRLDVENRQILELLGDLRHASAHQTHESEKVFTKMTEDGRKLPMVFRSSRICSNGSVRISTESIKF